MKKHLQKPWIICFAAAGFFFYQYMQLTMFNVLKPELIGILHTDAAVLSIISSTYFWGTVAFLMPAGYLLDIVSTRKIILWAMSISLIGLYVFVNAQGVVAAGIGRLLIGVSAGPVCLTAGLRLIARWFPEDRFAVVSGIIIAIGMLGAIVAQTPLTWLIQNTSYAHAMNLNLIIGVFFLIALWLLVVDCPPGKESALQQQMRFCRQQGFIQSFKLVVARAQNWYNAIFGSFLNLPVMLFGALWGIMYLTQAFDLSKIQASLACSALFFGLLIGSPIVGYISDHRGERKPPMYIGLLVCFISTTMLLALQHLSFNSIVILFFLIGFSSSAQILAYAAASESNPPALTGVAISFASTGIMAGSAIFQPIIGLLIKHGWDGTYVDQVPFYSIHDYTSAFWIMPIAYIVATVMVMRMREPLSH